VVNWATRYGSPASEIVVGAMDRLDLLPANGIDQITSPDEADLLQAGCVDVSLEAIEVPCELPAPATYLGELGDFFRALPAYSRLGIDLQSLITQEVASGGPRKLEATLGLGRAPRN
jgi:hypothetical protein